MVAPSAAAANVATFGTLFFFFVATVIIGRTDLCKRFDVDQYMSARNTQGSFSLIMSFFASGAGAWVLFTVPEAAILGGPIAVLGYAISCVLPLLIFACVGPQLRRLLPHGITFFEFVQARYGSAVNTYVTLIAMFYMFLYLAAEFTSVGDCVTLLSDTTDAGPNPKLAPIIGTSIVTLVYTTLGGLPVSLITDRVQGVGVLLFTVLMTLAAFGYALYPTYDDVYQANNASINWRAVSAYGSAGTAENSLSMAVVLILAVTSANLMHTGFQQRIWAAKDNTSVVYGLWGACILTLPFFLIFGLFGMIAYANLGPAPLLGVVGGHDGPYLAFLSAFFLIGTMPIGWQILAIILAVMMVASSADTIQTGLSGLFSPVVDRALCRTEGDGKKYFALAVNGGLTTVINIVAINLATQGLSVLSLFVLADLLCATCCVPVIMGLSDKVHPAAAISGCLAGLITALAVYAIGVVEPFFPEPGNFSLLFAPGGLYRRTSLYAFILTPLVSGLVTFLVAAPFHLLAGYKFAGYSQKAAGGAAASGGHSDDANKTSASDVVLSSA